MAVLHTFVSPRRYAQGAGALAEAGALIRQLGEHPFVVYDRAVVDLWVRRLRPDLAAVCAAVSGVEFAGECTQPEIDRVRTAAHAARADVVVGLGGGNTIDTARAVADDLDTAFVTIPTLAATHAPVSALSIVHTGAGGIDRYRICRHNPDLVLVDTQVIADAPVRSFIAGMGNAIGARFAARATAASYGTTMAGGWQTVAADALAEACWATLRHNGADAIAAARAHRVTDAVEKVIEATMLLSGLGFESGGMAAAHAIHNGLAALPETRGMWHGERVAFGVLAQLELERHPGPERRDVLAFCVMAGLPVCFTDLGVPDVTPAQIAMVAERAMLAGETIYNEPYALSPETVIAALRSVDARGRAAKGIAPVV